MDGAADLASSIVAGALWTFVSPVAALAFGAVVCKLAAIILWSRRPLPSN